VATSGQPTYLTLSSSGSTPWQITNWRGHTPFNLSIDVVSTGTWVCDCTLDDPTNQFLSPSSAAPHVIASSFFGTSSGAAANGTITFLNQMVAWRVTANSTGVTRVSALERGVG